MSRLFRNTQNIWQLLLCTLREVAQTTACGRLHKNTLRH